MSVADVLSVGKQDHPEAFQMAVRALELYERDCTVLQETNRFDFRRGFEVGYYTAMHNATRTDEAERSSVTGLVENVVDTTPLNP